MITTQGLPRFTRLTILGSSTTLRMIAGQATQNHAHEIRLHTRRRQAMLTSVRVAPQRAQPIRSVAVIEMLLEAVSGSSIIAHLVIGVMQKCPHWPALPRLHHAADAPLCHKLLKLPRVDVLHASILEGHKHNHVSHSLIPAFRMSRRSIALRPASLWFSRGLSPLRLHHTARHFSPECVPSICAAGYGFVGGSHEMWLA